MHAKSKPSADPGALGRASELQLGVWRLDPGLEPKLHALGERADTFKMQRALRQAGIDRGATDLAVFERGTRKASLIGKSPVGMIDHRSQLGRDRCP